MYQFNYFMPTKIFFGRGQVKMHPEIFASAGKKALIVTGRQSAKINGSYYDVVITSYSIHYTKLYDTSHWTK